jgi:Protein of unknown function (DUF2585)
MTTKYQKNVIYPITAMIFCVAIMVVNLYWQGRFWWCQQGDFLPWSFNIWSPHNSQHLIDPYTFTHILHGVLYFGIITFLFNEMPLRWKFFLVVLVECIWEGFENSSFIIERYRAATISLDYFGDSILNSLSDVLSCVFGAFLAYKLKFWRSFAFYALTEIILLFLIRDNLTLNIIMLIYPIEAIKVWQMG